MVIYYIDGEGKATDMGAVYENGYNLAGYVDLKINPIAADTTGDGEVNINDAVRLLRYLAGDTVTLGK